MNNTERAQVLNEAFKKFQRLPAWPSPGAREVGPTRQDEKPTAALAPTEPPPTPRNQNQDRELLVLPSAYRPDQTSRDYPKEKTGTAAVPVLILPKV